MKIGVIVGGTSSEREISILTGEEIINNLDKSKYEVIKIQLDNTKDFIDEIKNNNIDFAFIALHGEFGEDGKIQAILEALNIPYSGSGVLGSSICMNKCIAKKLLKFHNIPTPDWTMIKKDKQEIDTENIKYPVFVKPNNGGSSIGMSLVDDSKHLNQAIQKALKYDNQVIIEQYIKGSEITCCMLDGIILPTISIKAKSNYFDYTSKYQEGMSREEIISLDSKMHKKIEDICKEIWAIFDCKVYIRIDIIISDNIPYVLEINTLPGMTPNSLFPKSAKAYGMNFQQLLDSLIKISLNKTQK